MNIPEIKLGIVAVSRDCFPIGQSIARRQAIVKEYDGTNLKQLARKYGFTDRHIRTILAEEGMKKTS